MKDIIIKRGNEFNSMHNNSGLEFYAAWNELIDNSIDAGATKIRFECDKNSVTIIDNGHGITEESISDVLNMYMSKSNGDESKIGHYGIGLKEATMRLGKGITILSKSKGHKGIHIDVPWKDLDFNKSIKCDDSDYNNIGTSITIHFLESELKNIHKRFPNSLSFQYFDRLVKSKKLEITKCDGNIYMPTADPLFEERAKQKVYAVGGKSFILDIGILKKAYKSSSGFHIYSNENQRYFNRGQTTIGDNVDARDGLYVSVGLIKAKEDWGVDRNKRSIMEIEVVSEFLSHSILGLWKQKLYKKQNDNTIDVLQSLIASDYGMEPVLIGKQKRKKGISKGTVNPKGTDRKMREASNIVSHPYRDTIKKNSGKIIGIKLEKSLSGISEDKYMSISTENRVIKVRFNMNNSFINESFIKPSGYKIRVLLHLMHIGLSANEIKQDQILYNHPVDTVMTQNDRIDKYIESLNELI